MAPVPVTIKVLSLTLTEGQAFGLIPSDLGEDETLGDDAGRRQFVIRTLWDIVRNSNQAKPRADALDMLKHLGAMT